MGTGTLSSLLLLLLLVTIGDADMKGHFDPGEETESWVPEDRAWESESWGDSDPSCACALQPSAAMPWACRTAPFQTAISLCPAPGRTLPLPATAGT